MTVISIIGLVVQMNNGKRLERFSQSQKDSTIKFVKIDPYMITTLCFNFSMIIIWLTFVISIQRFEIKRIKNAIMILLEISTNVLNTTSLL